MAQRGATSGRACAERRTSSTKARAGSVDPFASAARRWSPRVPTSATCLRSGRSVPRQCGDRDDCRRGRSALQGKAKGARDHETNSELLNTEHASLTNKIGEVHAKRAEAWPQGAQLDSALASFDKRAARSCQRVPGEGRPTRVKRECARFGHRPFWLGEASNPRPVPVAEWSEVIRIKVNTAEGERTEAGASRARRQVVFGVSLCNSVKRTTREAFSEWRGLHGPGLPAGEVG